MADTSYLIPSLLAGGLVLTFFVLLSTGSILAVAVLWVLFAMVGFLLNVYGFVTADILAPAVVQPIGSATSSLTNVNIVGSEVFHVADNKFTYDDAPAVCAAYDSQLATLEQIIDLNLATAELKADGSVPGRGVGSLTLPCGLIP